MGCLTRVMPAAASPFAIGVINRSRVIEKRDVPAVRAQKQSLPNPVSALAQDGDFQTFGFKTVANWTVADRARVMV